MGNTFIICEAGINHNGNSQTAIELVDNAVECGVDAIKFQTSFTMPHMKEWEFSRFDWADLFDYCDLVGIEWFSTPFDFEAIEFLNEMRMDIWKIPSGMLTHYKYLEKIKSINPKRIILSTGMGYYDEVITAINFLDRDENIDVLHCTTAYPCPYDEVNLLAMRQWPFTGLSDHTQGIEVPIAAVAMGAKVIEKHFTLDRNMPGPDHKASLEPAEFTQMVKSIRNIEQALGNGTKEPSKSELQIRDKIRGIMGC